MQTFAPPRASLICILGGLGTLLAFWFLKAMLLWVLWHWVVWFVALPCLAVFGICEGVAAQRTARLHAALLSAAAGSLHQVITEGGR